MEITQTYARPSRAVSGSDGLRMELSAEQSRPPVFLEALVGQSRDYARAMLALHRVVGMDLRKRDRDHSAYQEWVQERYLEELGAMQASRLAARPGLLERTALLTREISQVQQRVQELERPLYGPTWARAERRYYGWAWIHDRAAWWVLDPVVSVHPDAVFFEAFSRDESTYARVTVPRAQLTVLGSPTCGTTNIDFSLALAREFERVRDYRPAWLQVGAESVTLATSQGEAVEKKIDLPPTWVRGFLQVQSAGTLPHTPVRLSASTLADVLDVLARRKERVSPRSLRFHLVPGERPRLTLEPWDITIHEPAHRFEGDAPVEIRIWGRRRLLALEALLPQAQEVEVRLLGTGLPSFWRVHAGAHTFDLGLSGWSGNDWARAARFHLLTAPGKPAGQAPMRNQEAATLLESRFHLSTAELAALTGWKQSEAAAALQSLCAAGQAMYDPTPNCYRWRPLFGFALPEDEADQQAGYAASLVRTGRVVWETGSEVTPSGSWLRARVLGLSECRVRLELNADGGCRTAECSCAEFRRNRLRLGPCAHLLAVGMAAASLGETHA